MASERRGNDCLASPGGRAALQRLTAVERVMCGRLIARQFVFSPKLPKEIGRYGLEGTVKLCSWRAIAIYMVPLGVIVVAFAVSGLGLVALPAYLLVLLVLALSLARFRSAARSGRRWRESQGKGG